MICKNCDKSDKSVEYHKSIILSRQGGVYVCPRCKVEVIDANNSWYPYRSKEHTHELVFEGRCVLCRTKNV